MRDPLSACEPHLHALLERGLPLIDDLRQVSRRQLHARMLAKWTSKPAEQQWQLAGVGMIDLGRVVLAHGSKQQQCTLVHVATHSIHYYRNPLLPPSDPLQQLHCAACNAALSILHLTFCPTAASVRFRRSLRDGVVHLLSAAPPALPWLSSHGSCELTVLLERLFPLTPSALPPAAPDHRHLARCMVGAFSRNEGTAASKRIGIPSALEGRQILQKVRLHCLTAIQQHFTSLKPPV